MTLLVPHLIDAVSTDADALRRALQTLSPGQVSSVLGTGDLKVTTSGGMVSVLAAGKGLAFNTQNAVSGGAYGLGNDAAVSQTHAASDPTNPRNDLVGVKVEDAFYSGTNKQATPVIVTGTPAPSPADPAVPANYLPCARVRVNAGASTLGTITDLRSFVFQSFLPGSNGMHFRDSANARDNVQWDDAGLVTLRNGLLIPPSVGGTLASSSYGSVPVKIAESVLGAPAATVTFSSIPGGFAHLLLSYVARDTSAGTVSTFFKCQMNGSAATNYYYTNLSGRDVAASAQNLADTAIAFGVTSGGGEGAGSAGGGLVFLPYYAQTSLFKQVVGLTAQDNGGSAGTNGPWVQVIGGRWTSTAAITSLTINCGASSFATGSGFALYGLP